MGRAREFRVRSRKFQAGSVVPVRELREGDEFVTLSRRLDGVVLESRGTRDGILVILGEAETRLHPDVRVRVA